MYRNHKNSLKMMTAAALIAASGLAVAGVGPDETNSDSKTHDEMQGKNADKAQKASEARAQRLRENARKSRIETTNDENLPGDGLRGEDEQWYDPTDWFDEDIAQLEYAYYKWRADERREDAREDIREVREQNRERAAERNAYHNGDQNADQNDARIAQRPGRDADPDRGSSGSDAMNGTERSRTQPARTGDRGDARGDSDNLQWRDEDDMRGYGSWDARRDRDAQMLYTDSYYDGYYDGYNDDKFGYDYVDDEVYSSRPVNQRGYSDGYYDGFYDQSNGNAMNANYYVRLDPVTGVTFLNVNEARDYEKDMKQRARDAARSQGDRAERYSPTHDKDKMADAGMSEPGDHAQKNAGHSGSGDDAHAMKRAEKSGSASGSGWTEGQHYGDAAWNYEAIRGTVKSVSTKSTENGGRIAQVKFEGGEQVLVDLNSQSDTFSAFEKGDRVTLRGHRVDHDGDEVLKVIRYTVNGKPMWSRNNGGVDVSVR